MNHKAIYNTHPNVTSIDDALGAFDKDGKQVTIDQSKVEEETKRLQDEFESLEYARKRQREFNEKYPIGDQLDYIFHHGLAKWKTDIVQPVKDKFKKP